jgi:hypothetical protein
MAEMTMAEHAEAWWTEQDNVVPLRGTPEWESMYEEWIKFAFADFKE